MCLKKTAHSRHQYRPAEHVRRIVTAVNLQQLRCSTRASAQLLAMPERYELVVPTVDHECRRMDARHVCRTGVPEARQKANGQIPVKSAGEIRNRSKRRN